MFENKHKRISELFINQSAIQRAKMNSYRSNAPTYKSSQKQYRRNYNGHSPILCQTCQEKIYAGISTNPLREYYEDTQTIRQSPMSNQNILKEYRERINLLSTQVQKKDITISKLHEQNDKVISQNEKLTELLEKIGKIESNSSVMQVQNHRVNSERGHLQTPEPRDSNEQQQKQEQYRRQIEEVNSKLIESLKLEQELHDENEALKQTISAYQSKLSHQSKMTKEETIIIQQLRQKNSKLETNYHEAELKIINLKNQYMVLYEKLEHSMYKNRCLDEELEYLSGQIGRLRETLYKIQDKSYEYERVMSLVQQQEEQIRKNQRHLEQIAKINVLQDSLCAKINLNIQKENKVEAMLRNLDRQLIGIRDSLTNIEWKELRGERELEVLMSQLALQ